MADSEDPYRLRWFNPEDRAEFLDLYDEAFGGGSEAWFDWKYRETPYVSHVPVLVADADGELAGARPQVPFRMRAGGEETLALRFGDTMVHPDHRRRGVFSRLTERALDHYRGMAPRFCFNCPNDLSRPGFLKAGGEEVATLPSYYRVQDPAALAGERDGTPGRVAGTVAGPVARAYARRCDRRASVPDDARVLGHADVPVDLLSRLYERAVPAGVHAVRDGEFLEWRYRNPTWDYTVYSAEVAGETTAALVTGTATEDGVTTANLVDVYPLAGGRERREGLRALLSGVLQELSDADVVAYSGRTVPPSLLRERGFLPDTAPPLSAVANPTGLVAYDLSGPDGTPWSAGGVSLRDPNGWALSYAELDAR